MFYSIVSESSYRTSIDNEPWVVSNDCLTEGDTVGVCGIPFPFTTRIMAEQLLSLAPDSSMTRDNMLFQKH